MIGLVGSAVRAGRLAGRHLVLAGRRRLVRMPMALITDEFGFSLAPQGWHPFREALENHDRRPDAPVEETTFGRFFLDPRVNAVRDLNDLLDLSGGPGRYRQLPRFWLGTYPWGGLSAAEIGGPGPAFGWAYDEAAGADTAERWGHGRTLWYRPDNRHTLANERQLTMALYRSIGHRYSPLKARGFPRVTILVAEDGSRRAVIVDGHHRLAVLAHLGVETVTVEIEAVVAAADADSWYAVRTGHCTAAEARRLFGAFFVLDGSERFELVAGSWEPGSWEAADAGA